MQMAGGSKRTKQVARRNRQISEEAGDEAAIVTQPIASASGCASPSTSVTPSTSDAEGRPSHPLPPPPDTEPTPPPPPSTSQTAAEKKEAAARRRRGKRYICIILHIIIDLIH